MRDIHVHTTIGGRLACQLCRPLYPRPTTPDHIVELGRNEIFVFGSNTKGIHGSGAARQARLDFGAKLNVGEGLTGRCYAFPTLNTDSWAGFRLQKRSDEELHVSAGKFIVTARECPHMYFLLTKVGCGLASYTEEHMKQFFVDTPSNVIKPKGW